MAVPSACRHGTGFMSAALEPRAVLGAAAGLLSPLELPGLPAFDQAGADGGGEVFERGHGRGLRLDVGDTMPERAGKQSVTVGHFGRRPG